jgi:hypothetical protein
MSKEKKISEEEMYEEKKVADPFLAGFYESMAKTNIEKITMTMMWKVGMKILRTGPGGQAIPSSESRSLSKIMVTP